MIFQSQSRPTELQRTLKAQVQSLFIGTVINDTSLSQYADIKLLINYRGGYNYDMLCVMQKNINAIKQMFPKQYSDFRGELLFQLASPRNETMFSICDRYIKAFSGITRYIDNDVYTAYRQFCGGHDDQY